MFIRNKVQVSMGYCKQVTSISQQRG